ncbi:hypothetical protein [Caldiplasma sukawensis]
MQSQLSENYSAFRKSNIKKYLENLEETKFQMMEDVISYLKQLNKKEKEQNTEKMKRILRGIISSAFDIEPLDFLLHCLAAINLEYFTNKALISLRRIYEESLNGIQTELYRDCAMNLGFNVFYNVDNNTFSVSIGVFTRSTRRISGPPYRLKYQTFKDGRVIVVPSLMKKILRELFVLQCKDRVNSIHGQEAEELTSDFKNELEEIKNKASSLYKEASYGSIDTSAFPPCIKEYMGQIERSENLPHLARFTLVAFLNQIGMDEKSIIGIFGNVPDFAKEITQYQVRHIMGEISGTKYSPPKCETLRSNHICYMGNDKLCHDEKTKHPLNYYKIKKKTK